MSAAAGGGAAAPGVAAASAVAFDVAVGSDAADASVAARAGALRGWVLLAGLWVGSLLPLRSWTLSAFLALVILAAAHAMPSPGRRLALVALCLVAAGSAGAGLRVALAARGPLVELARHGGVGELELVLVGEPRSTAVGTSALVRVVGVDGRPERARALLRLPVGSRPALGTRLAATATARPPKADGYEGTLWRLHVVAVVDPRGPPLIVAAPQPPVSWVHRARTRVRAAVRAHHGPDVAALLAGLVTGDTDGLSDEAAEAMADAGLAHLTAVSGSNVALVVGAALAVAGLLGLGARGRHVTALSTVVAFAVLTLAEPSVLRASAMAALLLVARLTGRPTDGRDLLASAALVVLLVDPLLAGRLGFVLSVCAAGGVLVVAPMVAAHLPGPQRLRHALALGIGAQMAVAPVLLATDDGVGLWSPLANLFAVPLAAVASLVAVAAGVLAQVAVGPAGLIAVLGGPPAHAVLILARVAADGPRIGWRHIPVVLLLFLAAVVARRLRPSARAACAVVLVALVVWGPSSLRARRSPLGPADLRLVALDVGQGDALLLEAPDGAGDTARLLVDGGPDEDVALAALRARGVARLDGVVLTHPHRDHAGGLAAVLDALPVGVLLQGPAARNGDEALVTAPVLAAASTRGVVTRELAAGQTLRLGTATADVLGPPPGAPTAWEPNDRSVTLRVTSGAATVLLTGDVEAPAQRRLLRTATLAADVLKVPHHGGATNAEDFLAAVQARVAVVSAGRDNEYGHPRPSVLAELAGAKVLRTDLQGEVQVDLTDDAVVARGSASVVAVLRGRAAVRDHAPAAGAGSERWTTQGVAREQATPEGSPPPSVAGADARDVARTALLTGARAGRVRSRGRDPPRSALAEIGGGCTRWRLGETRAAPAGADRRAEGHACSWGWSGSGRWGRGCASGYAAAVTRSSASTAIPTGAMSTPSRSWPSGSKHRASYG